MERHYSDTKNVSSPVSLDQLPAQNYETFYGQVAGLLKEAGNHCVSYYAYESDGSVVLICLIADDLTGNIRILSHTSSGGGISVKSLTPEYPQLHVFEREINENTGISFIGHPWMKPLRYSSDRWDKSSVIAGYPFYQADSLELHEVGVGPVHAGVIEPGHFRFICNGEKVLHLEIQLGYQHRGIENLLKAADSPLKRCLLAESIAGDTAVGHSIAHAQIIESLCGIIPSEKLQVERCIALELERIAIHIGDTAALCGDVAYQLGQVVCEGLRTQVINTTQNWCGNRFGKGLVRPGGTNYPMTSGYAEAMLETLGQVGKRYEEIADRIFSLSSVLARFEDIGTVTEHQASMTGLVGMAARTCSVARDIRRSHPFQYFRKYTIDPVILHSGDVLARAKLRSLEISASIKMIRDFTEIWKNLPGETPGRPVYTDRFPGGKLAISLVEGWRGEICHSVITGKDGKIEHYKVKDPSFHNWTGLSLAVRNQEISDFPVCNKSFNLSYCGNDL